MKKLIYIIFLVFFAQSLVAQTDSVQAKREYVLYTVFCNVVPDNWNYPLVGFINVAKGNLRTLQAGFVNTTVKNFAGLQLGFVNYADTVVGLPVGFLSIVRRGGYRALELSANELYPVNLAFKIGVKKFYTFFQASYNNSYEKRFGLGFGAGSLIDLGKNFYFNPEISTVAAINNHTNTTIFAPNFRYQFGKSRFQIFAAPSLLWLNSKQGCNFYETPFFSLINTEINNRNSLLIGARAGISVDL